MPATDQNVRLYGGPGVLKKTKNKKTLTQMERIENTTAITSTGTCAGQNCPSTNNVHGVSFPSVQSAMSFVTSSDVPSAVAMNVGVFSAFVAVALQGPWRLDGNMSVRRSSIVIYSPFSFTLSFTARDEQRKDLTVTADSSSRKWI